MELSSFKKIVNSGKILCFSFVALFTICFMTTDASAGLTTAVKKFIHCKGDLFFKLVREGRLYDVRDCFQNKRTKVDVRDSTYGATALMVASQEGNEEMAELLILFGADLDSVSTVTGKTPLLYALSDLQRNVAHLGMIKLLLEWGASIEKADLHYEYTPLMVAIRNNDIKAMRLLLDFNADPMVVSKKTGESAFLLAGNNNNQQLTDDLEIGLRRYCLRKQGFKTD